MIEHEQNIGFSEQSEGLNSVVVESIVQFTPPLPESQQPSEQQESHLFYSIEKYLEKHCCIKFILFLLIILLVIAVYQEKGYLIKKQRTFNFFIEKIQKEKIKKELISQTQDKGTPPVYTAPPQLDSSSSKNELLLHKAEALISQRKVPEAQLNPSPSYKETLEPDSEKYTSVEGINLSKIVQASRWRNLKNEDILMHSELANEEESYFQQKYQISKYKELPFCVVVPTFNNVENKRHISNIQTIVMQNYQNYRIIVIDDASTDSTGQQIKDYLDRQTKVKATDFTVVINSQNHGSAKNIRRAAFQYCQPHEIFMIVDGDDELIGRQVLKLFNTVYQETGAWVAYSNFFTEEGKLGYSKPIPERVIKDNLYRKYAFVTSHLRTLYTSLLRQIKEEDLLDKEGAYFTAANDVAILIPSLEMAHQRVIYIPELTYMYNQRTGLNNHKLKLTEQKRNQRYIRKKLPYAPLTSLPGVNSTMTEEKQKKGKLLWLEDAERIQRNTEDLGTVSDQLIPHKP